MDNVLIDTDVILDFFLIENPSLKMLLRFFLFVNQRKFKPM